MTVTAALAISCVVLAAIGAMLRLAAQLLDRRIARELARRPVDEVSGLPNREAFDWALLVAARRAARSGTPPTLVLVRTGAEPKDVSAWLGRHSPSGVQAFRHAEADYVLLAAPGIPLSANAISDAFPRSWTFVEVPDHASGSIDRFAAWLDTTGGPAS